MYGNQFRILRKKQDISLKKAAQGVTTISTLSRWENGDLSLKFDQVIELLDNIHITPLEFLSITTISPNIPLIDEINKATNMDSQIVLKRLVNKYISIYENSKTDENLFNAAITCNYYYEMTGKDLFSQKYQTALEDAFSNVKYWSYHYIAFLGNTVYLLSAKKLYGFSKFIIDNLEETKKAGYEVFLDTILTLLNIYELLIIKDPQKAKKLAEELDKISLNHYSMYPIIERNFLNELLYYRLTGKEHSIKETIDFLKRQNMDDLADSFNEKFEYIKNLNI